MFFFLEIQTRLNLFAVELKETITSPTFIELTVQKLACKHLFHYILIRQLVHFTSQATSIIGQQQSSYCFLLISHCTFSDAQNCNGMFGVIRNVQVLFFFRDSNDTFITIKIHGDYIVVLYLCVSAPCHLAILW